MYEGALKSSWKMSFIKIEVSIFFPKKKCLWILCSRDFLKCILAAFGYPIICGQLLGLLPPLGCYKCHCYEHEPAIIWGLGFISVPIDTELQLLIRQWCCFPLWEEMGAVLLLQSHPHCMDFQLLSYIINTWYCLSVVCRE